MQIGVLTLTTANPPLIIVFTWGLILFPGHLTNRKRFPEVVPRAVAALLAEIVWIQSLLSELRIQGSKPKLYSNNLGVVLLSANPVMHSKTKHFELDLHFVRDQVRNQKIQLLHLPARFQVTDPLTKPVSGILFLHVRDKLMIMANPTMSLRGVLRVPMC